MVRIALLFFCLIPFISGGQELDYGPMRKLPPTISSPYEDILPMQSQDGKTLFFSRAASPENVGGKFAGVDIWISQYDETLKDWAKPQNEKIFNDRGSNAVIGINEQGDEIYLLNTTGTKRAQGIYRSIKRNNSWSEPELIEIPGLTTEDFLGAYVTPDLKAIIFSMNGEETRGNEDLYISLKTPKGDWSKPRNLGSTINTSGFEMAPFLTPDKRRLYFSSNGHPGYGNSDIFYSDRLYESWEVWSAPKNLGLKINSPAFESFFSIYHDTVAYFSSNRNQQFSDIYRVSVFPFEEATEEDYYQYLSNDEVKRVSGVVFDPVLYFEPGISDINAEQQKNLQKINEGLYSKKDIKMRIIASKSGNGNLETYQKRLLNILDYLKNAGIEGNRIIFSVEQSEELVAGKELVRIRFYR
ncbi:MAG TPA: hypothetical protein VE467_06470 [Chryseolinea sp.]|nr:hypothetical protein [Chryseolinea sp.]